MTEFDTGRRDHLRIWALAEARRLRREAISLDRTSAPSPDGFRTEPGDAANRDDHIDAQDGLVVDWQLPPGSTSHAGV